MKNVTLLLSEWWGSGIVHAKVWISDHRDVYIGSANNDWKSLTQLTQKQYGISSGRSPEKFRVGLILSLPKKDADHLSLILWRFPM